MRIAQLEWVQEGGEDVMDLARGTAKGADHHPATLERVERRQLREDRREVLEIRA